MSCIMRNITAYKKWAVLVMIVVMSFDIFTGLRPLCANGLVPLLRALGIDRVAVAIGSPDDNREQASSSTLVSAEGRGGPSKCGCKKHKKCAVIPRTAITSNPTHRFNEVQRQAASVCGDYLVPEAPDHRSATRGETVLLELACRASSCSSTLLERTCILLV